MENNQLLLTYLACPYSHPDPNVQHMRHMIVNRVALELLKQGRFVYSPLTHNIPLSKLCNEIRNWAFWGKYDKAMLTKCNTLLVLTLPGWKTSNGVSAEIEFAKQLNLTIEMLDPIIEFGLDMSTLPA